jgi:hypothetical protein
MVTWSDPPTRKMAAPVVVPGRPGGVRAEDDVLQAEQLMVGPRIRIAVGFIIASSLSPIRSRVDRSSGTCKVAMSEVK